MVSSVGPLCFFVRILCHICCNSVPANPMVYIHYTAETAFHFFLFQSQEGDTARLAEELGAAKAKEKDAESRKDQELQKLSEEHDDLERKCQSEVRLTWGPIVGAKVKNSNSLYPPRGLERVLGSHTIYGLLLFHIYRITLFSINILSLTTQYR